MMVSDFTDPFFFLRARISQALQTILGLTHLMKSLGGSINFFCLSKTYIIKSYNFFIFDFQWKWDEVCMGFD